MKDDLVLVTGAGGFIGGSLVADLRQKGYRKIRAVDVKPIDEWLGTFSTPMQAFTTFSPKAFKMRLIRSSNQ